MVAQLMPMNRRIRSGRIVKYTSKFQSSFRGNLMVTCHAVFLQVHRLSDAKYFSLVASAIVSHARNQTMKMIHIIMLSPPSS